MQKKFSAFLVFFICSIFVFSCKTAAKELPKEQTAPTGRAKLSVTSVTWLIENLDPSFWDSPPKGNAQMFISFFVSYTGSFNLNDIDTVAVESPEDIWTLTPKQLEKITDINEKTKTAAIQRLQCGEGTGSVPLGKWKFTLTDTAGNKYEQVLDINGFEKTAKEREREENAVLPFEQEEQSKIKVIVPQASAKNQIAALVRPVIKSLSKDDNSIEIYFSVNDDRIKNGYFWFDVPGEKYYKDSGSMIDASGKPVNGCRAFSTGGKESRYILRKDSENAAWFDKITACFFVVSDTNRVSATWEERIRSVSAKTEIK